MTFFEVIHTSQHHLVSVVNLLNEPPFGNPPYLNYHMTGIMVGLVGSKTAEWVHSNAYVDMPIPELNGMRLKLIHWATVITPCSIENDAPEAGTGWAVDDFRVINPTKERDSIGIEADLAVRGIGSRIYRLAYQIDFIGYRVV